MSESREKKGKLESDTLDLIFELPRAAPEEQLRASDAVTSLNP